MDIWNSLMGIDKELFSPNFTKKYQMNLQLKLQHSTRKEFFTCKCQLILPSDLFKHIMQTTLLHSIWKKHTTWIQFMLRQEWNIFTKKPSITILEYTTKLMDMEQLFLTRLSWINFKQLLKTDQHLKICKWLKIINSFWSN